MFKKLTGQVSVNTKPYHDWLEDIIDKSLKVIQVNHLFVVHEWHHWIVSEAITGTVFKFDQPGGSLKLVNKNLKLVIAFIMSVYCISGYFSRNACSCFCEFHIYTNHSACKTM